METKEFPDSHSGVNIAREITQSLGEWGLSVDGLVAFTTDNASNVVVAMDELECIRVPCFSHCLNLAVEKACSITKICKVIARCCRLIAHFHHSSKDTYIFKQKQIDLHLKQQSLIQDVATRWNSSYYMIARVVEQQQPLCAALLEVKRTGLFPSDEEIAAMDVYMDVMKPLVTITETIGAQKWVTVSALRPLLYKLLKSHLVEKASDKRLAKKMKSEMHNNLNTRYSDYLIVLLSKAAFLDPRLKSLSFLLPDEINELHQSITHEAVQIAATENIEEIENTSEGPPVAKKAKGEHELFELLNDVIHPQSNTEQPALALQQKIIRSTAHYNGGKQTVSDIQCCPT